MAFLSNLLLSHQILLRILFTNQSSSILSMCPNHLKIHCSAWPAHSIITPILLCISSFLTRFIRVTPHILLRHFCSITFNLLFSATAILHVLTVGTTFFLCLFPRLQSNIHLSITNLPCAFHYSTLYLIHSQIPPPTHSSKFFHQLTQFFLQNRY